MPFSLNKEKHFYKGFGDCDDREKPRGDNTLRKIHKPIESPLGSFHIKMELFHLKIWNNFILFYLFYLYF